MTKYWLTSAAVVAMMTGSALAQSQSLSSETSVSTQTTTVPAPPVVDSVHTTRTQNSVDRNGVETDKSQSYRSGSMGTDSTASTQTIGPDGRPLITSRQERTVSPNGDTSTTNQTTATPPR